MERTSKWTKLILTGSTGPLEKQCEKSAQRHASSWQSNSVMYRMCTTKRLPPKPHHGSLRSTFLPIDVGARFRRQLKLLISMWIECCDINSAPMIRFNRFKNFRTCKPLTSEQCGHFELCQYLTLKCPNLLLSPFVKIPNYDYKLFIAIPVEFAYVERPERGRSHLPELQIFGNDVGISTISYGRR